MRKKGNNIYGTISLLSGILTILLSFALERPAIRDKIDTIKEHSSPNAAVVTSTPSFSMVIKVVDGDTIDVLIGDKKERVRLIGINTPEVVDPSRPVQCFGPEASKHVHELLDGKSVTLQNDSISGDRDKFGRLLRYVYRTDGLLVQEDIIKNGFGYEYTYHRTHYDKQNRFRDLEREAHQAKRGLWSPETCGGKL